MNSTLFTPTRLGGLELPNRILMAPLTRNRAEADGTPTFLMAEYYRQRASAGLLISEMTVVAPSGIAYLSAPGMHKREHVNGWRMVTRAVHEAGGRIVAQLAHGGRVSHSSLLPEGHQPVAPSALKPQGRVYTRSGPKPFETPRALETHEIPALVEQFRYSAELAQQAGFDGVEIHAANGYLIDQFLRSSTNNRTDEYGGSARNRARFLLEVADAMADVWGPSRIGVRISPWNAFNDISDADPERTFSTVAEVLRPLSLAYLHVIEPTHPPVFTRSLRETFGGAVIANGGHTAISASDAVANGYADAVSFGVPFLANPDLPERFAIGAPLNAPDTATFYGGGARGYIDYPSLQKQAVALAG